MIYVVCASIFIFLLIALVLINSPTKITRKLKKTSIGNPSRNQLIPQHIYQTTKDNIMDISTWNICKNIVDLNPEYTYHFYSNVDQRNFIKTHMSKRVLRAYDKLIPVAYKADLWRYCILYMKGGVYLDIPMETYVPLKDIINNDDTFISSRETFISDGSIYNAFIASVPKHPFLREAIDECVRNIENNYIGTGTSDPTGPLVLGRCINRSSMYPEKQKFKLGYQGERIKFKLFDHNFLGKIYDTNGKLVIYKSYPIFSKLFTKAKDGKPHYTYLWALAKSKNDPSYIYNLT